MIEVPLTKGLVAVIDDEDAERVFEHSWYAAKARQKTARWYAASFVEGEYCLLHRFILRAPKGSLVDHVNGDSLDCRKGNLRFGSRRQNTLNRRGYAVSGFRGVEMYAGAKVVSYRARITAPDKRIEHLGTFSTAEEAARAFDAAAIRYHGEWAGLNYPESRQAPC